MISSVESSLSGIGAAVNTQNVSANNVANANTEGFKKQVVTAEEQDNGGVKVTLSKPDTPGVVHGKGDGVEVESSNVDIAEEVATQISAENQLKANTAALKTADRMIGGMLDIMA